VPGDDEVAAVDDDLRAALLPRGDQGDDPVAGGLRDDRAHVAAGVRQHLAVLVGDRRGDLVLPGFTISRKAKRIFVRRLSDVCDHSSKAAAAAATARSTSLCSASRTSACCSPVAGLNT
jgi:hypothetical protein